MPLHCFNPQDATYDSSLIYYRDGKLKLRRQDINGDYDRIGSYPEFADVEFENFQANAITELFAFTGEINFPNGLGDVRFQLSNDNGLTWLFFDGSTWAEATESDFSSLEEVDANILSFPFSTRKQVKLKVRIFSDNSRQFSPEISFFFLGLELDYNALEDAIRTIKHYFENNLKFKLDFRTKLAKDSNKATLKSNFEILTENFRAFNLTRDPYRVNNIFSSYDTDRKLVYFSETQSEGSIIFIEYEGKAPIYVGADEEYIMGKLPSLVMTYSPTTYDRRLGGNLIYEILPAKGKARERMSPEFFNFPLTVGCQASYNWETMRMARAVNNLFETARIYSEATGEELRLIWPQESFKEADVIVKGLYRKDVTVTVFAKEWSDSYKEIDLCQEIILNWGDSRKVWESQKII